MSRLAGYALAGAGLGGLSAGGLSLAGAMPSDRQRELEQQRLEGVEVSPEQEQAAQDEAARNIGVAALAVGGGAGLGALASRFAGRPDVVGRVVRLRSGGTGVDGAAAAVPGGPPLSPPSAPGSAIAVRTVEDPVAQAAAVLNGEWLPSSGRRASDEEAQRLLDLMTNGLRKGHVKLRSKELAENMMEHLNRALQTQGAERFANALDYTRSNWDGDRSTMTEFDKKLVESRDMAAHVTRKNQGLIDSLDEKQAMARNEHTWIDELFEYLSTPWTRGDDHVENSILQLAMSPDLTNEDRQLVAGGLNVIRQHNEIHPSSTATWLALQSLNDGQGGELVDKLKGEIEQYGGNPDHLSVPQWIYDYKGVEVPGIDRSFDSHEARFLKYIEMGGSVPDYEDSLNYSRRLDHFRRQRLGL